MRFNRGIRRLAPVSASMVSLIPLCFNSKKREQFCARKRTGANILLRIDEEHGIFPRVTQCADGSWCCNHDPDCCDAGRGNFLDAKGNIVVESEAVTEKLYVPPRSTAPPSSSSSPLPTTSETPSASQTPEPSTTPSTPSPSTPSSSPTSSTLPNEDQAEDQTMQPESSKSLSTGSIVGIVIGEIGRASCRERVF